LIDNFFFFCFLVVLGFEHRASLLLDRSSSTWVTSPLTELVVTCSRVLLTLAPVSLWKMTALVWPSKSQISPAQHFGRWWLTQSQEVNDTLAQISRTTPRSTDLNKSLRSWDNQHSVLFWVCSPSPLERALLLYFHSDSH
jgi:hypothetical protein